MRVSRILPILFTLLLVESQPSCTLPEPDSPTASLEAPHPTDLKATPVIPPEELLRFILGRQLLGCDLNDDGQTNFADLLIGLRDGVPQCFFDTPLLIHSDPLAATAFTLGRGTDVLTAFGVKDATGNLLRLTGLRITSASEADLELEFDEAGQLAALYTGEDFVTFEDLPGDSFEFVGALNQQSLEGNAEWLVDPTNPPDLTELSALKRTTSQALKACPAEKDRLAEKFFGHEKSEVFASPFQSTRVMLSVFLIENDLACECLDEVFSESNLQRPEVVVIRILDQLLYQVRYKLLLLGLFDSFTRPIEPYRLTNTPAQNNIRRTMERTENTFWKLLTLADHFFEEIASTLEVCGGEEATPTETETPMESPTPTATPTPTFPTGEFRMVGGFMTEGGPGMVQNYPVSITLIDGSYKLSNNQRSYDAEAAGSELRVHAVYSGTTEDAVYADQGNGLYSVQIHCTYTGGSYQIQGTLYPRSQWGPMTGYYSGTYHATATQSSRPAGAECLDPNAAGGADASLFDFDGQVQILNSSFGLTMNARNNWQNPSSFASSSGSTASWSGQRGETAFGYCGIPFTSEDEGLTLTRNESGTQLTGTFTRSVQYSDGTTESQTFEVVLNGGGGHF